MATRIRRIPWGAQPPSGVEAQSQWAAAFNFSNSAVDLAGGVGEFASFPAAGFTSGPEGVGLEFATSNVSTASSRITPGITNAITAVMVIEPVGSTSTNSNFLFGEAAASVGNYNWGFYSNSSGYPTVFVHNGTTGVAAIYTFYVWQNVRRPQVWVMTYGGGDNNIRLFVDGLVASSAAQTGNIRRDANAHLGFQRWNTAGVNCRLYAAGVLPRRLSEAEALALSSAGPVRSAAWNELFGGRRVPLPASAGVGGDVSLALTGQGGSFSQGVFTLQRETPVAGQSATFSAGLLGASLTIPLTGVSGAFAPGSVVPSVAVALIGLSATAAQGSPAASITLALTGQAGTFATGTVTASTGDGATLVGQGGTFSQGTPGVSITVALTGITATLATGIVSAASGSATITLKAGSWLRYKKLI